VLRLSWLREALADLGAPPEVPRALDAAGARPLGPDALAAVAAAVAGPPPAVLAVDDADALDETSATELAWLVRRCPGLRVVLAYRYPSTLARTALFAVGSPLVLRLAPLTAEELAPLGGGAALAERTGGIPALVAAALPDAPPVAAAVAMQVARQRTRWMPPAAWQALRACAVLGPLTLAELAGLVDAPAAELVGVVDDLVHAHLLGEGPDGTVAHRSGMVREAVAEQVSATSARHLAERRVGPGGGGAVD
jgi:hypothetical protein